MKIVIVYREPVFRVLQEIATIYSLSDHQLKSPVSNGSGSIPYLSFRN